MTIEERVEALEKETQKLRDIVAIMNLKGKYFRCLDSKDWDGLAATLSPNIRTSYSNGKLTFHGVQEAVEYFKKNMPPEMISMHMGHTPEITILSETEATARWYLQDNLIFTQDSPYAGVGIQGGAFYTDRYEKIDGQWRIAETGYIRIYEESFKRPATRMTANMHEKKQEKNNIQQRKGDFHGKRHETCTG